MKIYFAGAMGAEFKNERLKKIILRRRLVSFHYMTPKLNQQYFNKEKKGLKNEQPE